MRIPSAAVAAFVALVTPTVAWSGPLEDWDNDLVASQYDNCQYYDNGPNEPSNQVDTDLDGYGNACDADYDNTAAGPNSFLVSGTDFARFVSCFGSSAADCLEADHTGDGLIAGTDFGRFVQLFGGSMQGASGLYCAGMIPCMP